MDKKNAQRLKKFIRELEAIRGRHTELVSVYVPQGYDIIKIIQHLEQEQGTATNIKDKNNRQRVIDSLEKMIRHLRLYKKTPENGLAAFAGNASQNESKIDIKVWSIEPPVPIQTRLYRCDQTFVLDILKNMLEIKEVYALIVVDNRDGTLGLLRGNTVTELIHLTSGVPGKIKAGGQCLMPDTSIDLADGQLVHIEDLEESDEVVSYDFENKRNVISKVNKVWKTAKNNIYIIKTFEDELQCSADHLLFLDGGITKTAFELTKEDIVLDAKGNPVKIKSIKVIDKEVIMIDIEVAHGNFVANNILVHNSQARFARLREGAAKDFYKRIAEYANKEFLGKKEIKGIIIGGPGPTKETFLDGDYLNNELKKKVIGVKDLSYTGEFGLNELVDKSSDLLAQESIIKEKNLVNKVLETLAKQPEKVAYGKEEVDKALEMGAVEMLLLSEDIEESVSEELEAKANRIGATVEFVSTETKEGKQIKEITGIVALLRFAIR
ncbi:hypothetical protein HY500_02010 [Candidatus Woesearchaeota archaeon]|nr:hypothetical protein [Candidatus Woesearchaeota archaeon]